MRVRVAIPNGMAVPLGMWHVDVTPLPSVTPLILPLYIPQYYVSLIRITASAHPKLLLYHHVF